MSSFNTQFKFCTNVSLGAGLRFYQQKVVSAVPAAEGGYNWFLPAGIGNNWHKLIF